VRALLGLLIFGLAARLFAQQPAAEEGFGRFCAVDIYIDSKGAPLAAYQLEFAVTNGLAKIVGIEGGEHAAFRQPPFYDPKAIQHGRVIVAALSTESPDQLPNSRTRVLTVHLQCSRGAKPQFALTVQAAANVDAQRVSVDATFEERDTK
jgi:hypothetical protein